MRKNENSEMKKAGSPTLKITMKYSLKKEEDE
jgi:hypothetical protein